MLKNYSSFTKKEIINAFYRLQLRLWIIIILLLLGIAYISYGIYTIYTIDNKFIFLFFGIAFITLSIALAIIPYFMSLKANKDLIDIDYDLTFYDSYFEVIIKKGNEIKESSINYNDIYKMVKKGNIFYIYLEKDKAIILKLNNFNEDDRFNFLNLMKGIR